MYSNQKMSSALEAYAAYRDAKTDFLTTPDAKTLVIAANTLVTYIPVLKTLAPEDLTPLKLNHDKLESLEQRAQRVIDDPRGVGPLLQRMIDDPMHDEVKKWHISKRTR